MVGIFTVVFHTPLLEHIPKHFIPPPVPFLRVCNLYFMQEFIGRILYPLSVAPEFYQSDILSSTPKPYQIYSEYY